MSRPVIPPRVASLDLFAPEQRIGTIFMTQSSVNARIDTGPNSYGSATDGIRSLPPALRAR